MSIYSSRPSSLAEILGEGRLAEKILVDTKLNMSQQRVLAAEKVY